MPVTNGPLVWIQVPVAVDSGCCRHVTPNGVFCLVPTPMAGSEAKQNFYGAGGDAIACLGGVNTNGVTDASDKINLDFEVCNITRPLASVHEMMENGNDLVFSKTKGCYILCVSTGKKIPLRQENKLFFLDIWVQVPPELAKQNPFARQSVPQ